MEKLNRLFAQATAKNLYQRRGYDATAIAKYTGITRQTIVRWISEGNWKRGCEWNEFERFDRTGMVLTPEEVKKEGEELMREFKMEVGHRYELQSIKWKIDELDEKISKGRKQKKKISHLLEEKKNLKNRALEIETRYWDYSKNQYPQDIPECKLNHYKGAMHWMITTRPGQRRLASCQKDLNHQRASAFEQAGISARDALELKLQKTAMRQHNEAKNERLKRQPTSMWEMLLGFFSVR